MPCATKAIWTPTVDYIKTTRIYSLMRACGFDDYDAFAEFCLQEPEKHWRAALDQMDIEFDRDFDQLADESKGKPWPEWFQNGQFNCVTPIIALSENTDTAQEIAVVCENEAGQITEITRAELVQQVRKMAASLQSAGIVKGDRIAMLLPNCAEAVFLPLACAYLGAILVPLYSGFGPKPIIDRVQHCRAKLLVTAKETTRNQKTVSFLPTVQKVLSKCSSLEKVFVVRARDKESCDDIISSWTYEDGSPIQSPPIATDPNDPVMIIYTSGTTGKPKGTVHSHGGFPLRIAYDLAFIFNVESGDRFFWFSDMGWMIGPMVVFGPLLLGATSIVYEGSPTTPDATRLLDVASRHKVTHFGSAPTLSRGWKAAGILPKDEFRSSLKILMTAGEVIDPGTFIYLFHDIGGGKPVINYSGGTEVSGGLLVNVPVKPIAPSLFNASGPGISLSIRHEDGSKVEETREEVGELAIDGIFPGMTHGLWEAPDVYLSTYWARFPGCWSHGDLVQKHEDFWEIRGRADDVLKLSGRRIGPSEIEALLVNVSDIEAVAAIGLPDDRQGETLHIFAVTVHKDNGKITQQIERCIIENLGKAFRPSGIHIVSDLPRTRNNKIMRRVIKQVASGQEIGDISSLDNPNSLADIPRVGIA